jgi:DNA-binding NtrC family response regulator
MDVERAAIDGIERDAQQPPQSRRTLGIGKRTLYRKLKEYAID